MTSPLLALKGISKIFGDSVANDNIDLEITSGSIHGLIGENGAGKSTLMHIVSGLLTPTSGVMVYESRECVWASPREALQAGIGMVHQHALLADDLTVLDNIVVGAEPGSKSWWSRLDRQEALASIKKLMGRYGLDLALDARVADLTAGERQRVEILKLLYRQCRLLIFDEPTAVLSPVEIEKLFEGFKALQREGRTIVLISHKLKEILAVCDTVSVLRDGKKVADAKASESSYQTLALLMTGSESFLAETHPNPGGLKEKRQPALKVSHLTLSGGELSLSLSVRQLDVHPGEIVGLAGVSGNGQELLWDVLLHPREYFKSGRAKGCYEISGRDARSWSPRSLKKNGVAATHPDRQSEDLVLPLTLSENFFLGRQDDPEWRWFGLVRQEFVHKRLAQSLKDYDVRAPGFETAAGSLSGGNQQKLVMARELLTRPKLLLVAEPTRGVDISASRLIHERLIAAANAGAAILLLSSDLDEILALSQRIFVMNRGTVTAQFNRADVKEAELGLAIGGMSLE